MVVRNGVSQYSVYDFQVIIVFSKILEATREQHKRPHHKCQHFDGLPSISIYMSYTSLLYQCYTAIVMVLL